MKFFISGTTGFLGQSLKEHFEPNHEVKIGRAHV